MQLPVKSLLSFEISESFQLSPLPNFRIPLRHPIGIADVLCPRVIPLFESLFNQNTLHSISINFLSCLGRLSQSQIRRGGGQKRISFPMGIVLIRRPFIFLRMFHFLGSIGIKIMIMHHRKQIFIGLDDWGLETIHHHLPPSLEAFVNLLGKQGIDDSKKARKILFGSSDLS